MIEIEQHRKAAAAGRKGESTFESNTCLQSLWDNRYRSCRLVYCGRWLVLMFGIVLYIRCLSSQFVVVVVVVVAVHCV